MIGPDDDTTAARTARHRSHASVAALVVLVVAACGGGGDGGDVGERPTAVQEVDPTWRWESYRGVQVRVPPDWGHGVAHSSWCAGGSGKKIEPRPGAVGRPAPIPAILCPSDYPPVDEREDSLSFDHEDHEGVRRVDHGWVEETRRVDGVHLTVLSDDDGLRAAILGSARAVRDEDAHGCPTVHPVVTDPGGYRPEATPSTGAAESISVCRYSLEGQTAPPLLGSRRVTGTEAAGALAAIRSAPEGEGPDGDEADHHGTEIVVLRAATSDGTQEIIVRYSGSSRNGFDDGTTRHRLTAEGLRLLTGPAHPGTFTVAVAGLFDQ